MPGCCCEDYDQTTPPSQQTVKPHNCPLVPFCPIIIQPNCCVPPQHVAVATGAGLFSLIGMLFHV
jgi:hypothetical protein